MLKILPKKQLVIGCVALVSVAKPLVAQEIVEVNRKFVWVEVPGTLYSSEWDSSPPDLTLYYINSSNVVRRRNIVVFEVVTPDAVYLRMQGTCQTEKTHELYKEGLNLKISLLM